MSVLLLRRSLNAAWISWLLTLAGTGPTPVAALILRRWRPDLMMSDIML